MPIAIAHDRLGVGLTSTGRRFAFRSRLSTGVRRRRLRISFVGLDVWGLAGPLPHPTTQAWCGRMCVGAGGARASRVWTLLLSGGSACREARGRADWPGGLGAATRHRPFGWTREARPGRRWFAMFVGPSRSNTKSGPVAQVVRAHA